MPITKGWKQAELMYNINNNITKLLKSKGVNMMRERERENSKLII